MATIPTILSGSSASSRYSPGYASPSAFGDDKLSSVAQGLNQVAAGASAVGRTIQSNKENTDHANRINNEKIERERLSNKERIDHERLSNKERIDHEWAVESASKIQRSGAEWSIEPTNANREDMAAGFSDYTGKVFKNFLAEAPSDNAKKLLNKFNSGYQDDQIPRMMANGQKNMMANTQARHTRVLENINATFLANGDPVQYEKTLLSSITNINNNFDEIAPQTALSEREHTYSEMVATIAPTNPAAAETMLNRAEGITEQTRQSLLKRVESYAAENLYTNRYDFEQLMSDDMREAAENLKTYSPRDLESFNTNYPPKVALAKFKEDQRWATTHNEALKMVGEAYRVNPNLQEGYIHNMMASLPEMHYSQRTEIRDRAIKLLQDNRERAIADPFDWVERGHFDELNKKNFPQDARARNLAYQGYPPKNDEHPEWYLGLPENERRLISKDEAAELAGQLMGGNIRDISSTFQKVMNKYTPSEQAKVFNDLIASEKIHPFYSPILNIAKELGADYYIGAITAPSTSSPAQQKDLGDALSANEVYNNWAFAMGSPYGNRNSDINAYRSAVLKAADFMLTTGHPEAPNVESAVAVAANYLVNRTMATGTVNGAPTMISRDIGGKPRITVEEQDDVFRRLDVAMEGIDPRLIKASMFGMDDSNPEALQAIFTTIITKGRLYPTDDGTKMYVYVPGSTGPVQLTSKAGNAVKIDIRLLPDFRVTTKVSTNPLGVAGGSPLKSVSNAIMPDDDMNVIEVDKVDTPFAFGHALFPVPFIGKRTYNEFYPDSSKTPYISY